MDHDDQARTRQFKRPAPCKSLTPPNRSQKPSARAGAAPIWWSPRRRLTLPARLPSDISTLHKSRHLYFVANTTPMWDERSEPWQAQLHGAEAQCPLLEEERTCCPGLPMSA